MITLDVIQKPVTKTIAIHENRASFNMVTAQYLSDHEIVEKLMESEHEANDPNTQWLSHEEVFKPLREKYGYEIHG